jgi:transposase
MIENAGARVIYLPSYSPELNPIEPYWSAFKKHLRRLAARTVDALFAAIDLVRRRRIVTRRMFAHCGYA